MKMIMNYEVKYDSGKKKIYAFTILLIISILFAAIMPSLILFWGVVISFGAVGVIGTILGFRTLYLYPDRMEIQDVFGRIQIEVAYNEIKRIGFLHSHESYTSYRSPNSAYNDQGAQMEELIILLKDSGRMQIDAGDFDEIHTVCAFIQRKTGQY
jgi:hypothetical protein